VRILHLVAGEKWTGIAAVVYDWARALVDAGLEAQFAFVGDSPLARRIAGPGWVRPLLTRPHGIRGTLRDLPALRATIRRERFDVVHTHSSHDHALAVAAGGRNAGSKIVRTLHHIRHARPDTFMRAVFARTHAFAFANRAIAEAAGAGAKGGPVHSPVVDSTLFSPCIGPTRASEAELLPRGTFVVGTVGKLARGRGHEEAIAAVAPLADAAAVLHVGKGEHLPALQALSERLGVRARNVWAGYQDEALPDFYRAMDVFLFTASGSQQGQRAILEAMATGLPVVALNVPGVADLLTDGVEGFVAADVSGATGALRRLAADPELRTRMGAAARRRAATFGAAAFASSAREFYARVRDP
jgi:glycosyltransferase involved in cell wall biosynthesis